MRKVGRAARVAFILAWMQVPLAEPAAAQTAARQESFAPARVAVLRSCPSNGAGVADRNEALPALGAAAVSVFAGAVSDVVKAGVQTLAGVIDQVSREKAFGAEGSTSFAFYSLTRTDQTVLLDHRLRVGEGSCLVLALDETQGDARATPGANPSNLPPPLLAELERLRLPRPALYMEAYLRMAGDGFEVRPQLVWYARRLKGAPGGALPIEIQATFATPGTAEAGSGAFAVARIALPAMAPGTALAPGDLTLRTSGALAPRPTTGAVDARRQTLTAAWAAVVADAAAGETATADVAHAQEDLRAAGAPTAALRAKVVAARRLVESTARRRERDEQAAKALLPGDTEDLGTTTVTARLAFVRAPTRFGQAIADALKARAPATATTVETALTNSLSSRPAWSAAETTFVQAVTAVATAQQAHDAAMAGTDASAQATTLATLRNAQAAANAAAAVANRPLPYPELMTQIGAP